MGDKKGKPTVAESAQVKRSRLSVEARHLQLLDIAEELFVSNGYEATTLEDIARVANVTRPLIYGYFSSKEEIFLACASRARSQFDAAMLAAMQDWRGGTPVELLTLGGDVFFTMLKRDPKRWSLLFGSTMAQDGLLAQGLLALREETIEKIAVVLRQFVPEGYDEATLACAYALSGVGEQLGRWWQRHPRVPKAKVLAYYSHFIAAGLESVKQMELSTPATGRRTNSNKKNKDT